MAFLRDGELAQLGERLVCNQEVTGSSPVFSTIVARVCSRRDAHRSLAQSLEGGWPVADDERKLRVAGQHGLAAARTNTSFRMR